MGGEGETKERGGGGREKERKGKVEMRKRV